ncbi:uncharacterized protein TNCV_2253431 [Trichonephila clavipes]|nr:uncharacterized protein TNCV_2253431 [Trichonephila clavipes]
MRQAIWAIFLHKLSTDEYPQHGFCPIGKDSWCGFKKAETSCKSYKHKNSLPVAVVEAMRPIFRDLSHPDLLKKCLHGKTQNPNESFHNVIWSRVPKATFVQIETLSLGVYDAVCSFIDGNVSKLKMLQKLGVEPGEFSVSAMKLLDRERLMKAIYAFSGRSKKIRKDKRRKRKKDNIKKNKVKTGYSAGSFLRGKVSSKISQLGERHKVGQSLTSLCIQNNEEEWSVSTTRIQWNMCKDIHFICSKNLNEINSTILEERPSLDSRIKDEEMIICENRKFLEKEAHVDNLRATSTRTDAKRCLRGGRFIRV